MGLLLSPVVLCEDVNFGGRCEVISGDVPDLANHPPGDNTLSSLAVPRGIVVAVFEHPDFQGQCETFTSDEPDLRNRPIGQDVASSIRLGVSCPLTEATPAFPESAPEISLPDPGPWVIVEDRLPSAVETLFMGMRSQPGRPVAW